MKLDKRFHCFGCGADGDVINFTARLFNLNNKEAAEKLAADFSVGYEDWKPPDRKKTATEPAADTQKYIMS